MSNLPNPRAAIAALYKARREALILTPDEVAAAAGISANTYRRIEAARFAWDIDLHILICTKLNLTPCQLKN